ncbi:hypothetical protein BKA66DRAFT_424871, partial [Pyrenochaeta sp. MPI-SDFR-AT-0127]
MTWNFIGFASCRIDYNPSHNQQLEIETLIVTFTDILSAVLKNPGIALAAIEFPHALDQLRRCQYPVDPPMEQPLPGNLIEAFQHSLLHHKKRIALIEGSLQLTYSELDDTSSFFAHGILTQLGQDPPKDRFIALCIPQSALALIAILGILKTGNAYAPIDIRQAPERVFEMLKCAGSPPLLISKDSPDFLRHGEFKQWTIDITGYLEEWRDSTSSATLELIEPVPCSKLACLLFTSGTTGKPKGVRVSHQNILTLALNDDAVLVREDDRVAQINNLAWDTVHLETWCPLLRGAAIVCFDRYVILDPLAVKDNFKAFGITATFFSAALLRFFVSNEPKLFESLRLLHTGGETGRFEHFIKARKANPELVIQNSYGPMECCVYSTTRIMGPSTNLPETGNVPIGSPLKTAQVLLLDCQGRPVPPGIIGEIWISGRHVADGYEGREEDTKDSFVQIQVSGLQKSPRTYYRSGDRGRLNAACEIEFCGRINFEQIKVRGQRMELSDVEASIARVLMMEDVAVSYHQTEGQLNSALIGYVIRGQAWDNIVEALRHSLPAYMIPDALYIVDFVPLTTNSKIDRAKLKKIAGVDFNTVEETDVVLVVHRNEIEYKLCSIFQALLGSKAAISPTIDFFARGGHSLLAMKLRYAVQDAFKVNVALADIFETPTPEGLARKISRLNPIELIKQAPTYVKRAGTAIAELSFPQLRMWFMHQLNPESVLYNSGFCYHFQAAVNEGVLERTITELVSRHDCMRMTFLEEDGVPKSEITGIYPTLEKVNIDGKTEDDLKTLIREHCYRPYNLHSEPPIRPVLFMKKGESFLLVGMHHIITDGSSVELWTREMEMIYPALLHGKQLPLESLPWTYQDFAVWQRSDDFEHLLKPQIEYWKAQLNGSEPCRFPADYTNESLGPALSNGKRMIVTLEKALKDKLHLVCRRFGVTWFMLLSAMARAVQFQWTAQQDGSFCFPNANRRRAEISEVSGLFVNTQVLRLKCHENMLFSELLQQSRRVSLEAFTNEDVPFDRLVKELNPTRTLNQNPLSEIMFAYQNFDFWSFDMGNIPAEMYPYWAESTRFDLEIQWFDYGDTLQCELNYRDSVFKKTTIQEISNKMMKFLQAVADDQD